MSAYLSQLHSRSKIQGKNKRHIHKANLDPEHVCTTTMVCNPKQMEKFNREDPSFM